MVRAVLTWWLTGSGFDLAWFSTLSSERLCIFGLHHEDMHEGVFQHVVDRYDMSLTVASTAWPVRPVPDKYAFQATDKRTNEQTNERTDK